MYLVKGAVVKARNRENGNWYALKTIDKNLCGDLEKLREEVSIIKQLDHPNIAKMFESFEDTNTIYLVMELCTGGELYDRLAKLQHFREHDAARLVSKMFTAVRYCHDHGVAHRDLKLQNWLFENDEDNAEVKLIDFGLSKRYYRSPYGSAPMPDRSKTNLSLGKSSDSIGVDGTGVGESTASTSNGDVSGGSLILDPKDGSERQRKLSISSPARHEIEKELKGNSPHDHRAAAAAATSLFQGRKSSGNGQQETSRKANGNRGNNSTGHGENSMQIKRLYSKVGTSYYVAPEVIARTAEREVMGYDETVDVWSMGVITYMLLSGRAPFMGDNDQQILRAVRRGKWFFAPHRIWSRISEDAKGIYIYIYMKLLHPSKMAPCCVVPISTNVWFWKKKKKKKKKQGGRVRNHKLSMAIEKPYHHHHLGSVSLSLSLSLSRSPIQSITLCLTLSLHVLTHSLSFLLTDFPTYSRTDLLACSTITPFFFLSLLFFRRPFSSIIYLPSRSLFCSWCLVICSHERIGAI